MFVLSWRASILLAVFYPEPNDVFAFYLLLSNVAGAAGEMARDVMAI